MRPRAILQMIFARARKMQNRTLRHLLTLMIFTTALLIAVAVWMQTLGG